MSSTAQRPPRVVVPVSGRAAGEPAGLVDEVQVDRAIGHAVRRLMSLAGADPQGEASLEEMGRLMAEEGRRLVRQTEVVVSVVPSDRPHLFVCIGGAGPWAETLRGREWPLHEGMLHGRAMLRATPIETLNGPGESALPGIFGSMRAGRLVPIGAGSPLPDGRIGMGAISFWRERAEAFSATERAIIDAYGRLVGLGLLRSEARSSTTRLVARLEASAEIAQELAATLEPEAVVETIIKRAADLLRADRATLIAVRGGEAEVVGGYDASGRAPAPGSRYPLTANLRRVIRAGRPSIETKPDVAGLPADMRSQLRGVRHRITIPLAAGGEVVAALAMSRRHDEVFTQRDAEDLSQIGTRAALALRNSELYAERRGAQDKALTALNEISRHLEVTGSMAEFFGRLTTTIGGLVGAQRVAFWRLAGDQRSIGMVPDAFGFSPHLVDTMSSLPCDAGGDTDLERVLFHDRVFHGRMQSGGPKYAEFRRQFQSSGVREVLMVSWRAGDSRLGLVGAYDSTKPGGFTPEDAWILQLAALAGGLVWQLKATEEQIRTLGEVEASRLREHVDRMTALEQVKSDFLKLASHELRTPLALVKGYLDMVSDGSLPREDFQRAIPVIQGRTEQMNRVINEMLETARLEEGRLDLSLRPGDLGAVVRTAARSVSPLLTPAHRLTLRLPSQPVVAMLDEGRTQTILSNLLDNALKFSPDGGEVRCTVTVGGGRARVHVVDHGLGIAREDLPRLFTRFGRLVTPENSHISGTGLGLYISRQLARLQGGDISVRSAPGRGTRFSLSLPLAARRA